MGPRRWAKKLGIPMPPTKTQVLIAQLEWYTSHELGINNEYVLQINQRIILEQMVKDLAPTVFKKYQEWVAKMKKIILDKERAANLEALNKKEGVKP